MNTTRSRMRILSLHWFARAAIFKWLSALIVQILVLQAPALSNEPIESTKSRESSTLRRTSTELIQSDIGQTIYRSIRIPVRQELALGSYYNDRALNYVAVEYYPDSNSTLVLLLDGRPAGRPQYAQAGRDGTYFFNLPQRRNYLGRNFQTVQLQISGYGYAASLFAELGDDYLGDRPLPPNPPYPPYPAPVPPFPPFPPGPVNPIP